MLSGPHHWNPKSQGCSMPRSAPRPPKDDTATSSRLSTMPFSAPTGPGCWHEGPTQCFQHCVGTHAGAQDQELRCFLHVTGALALAEHKTSFRATQTRHSPADDLLALAFLGLRLHSSDGVGSSSLRPATSIPVSVLANQKGCQGCPFA